MLVVEDVIGTDARDTHVHPAKGHALEKIAVDPVAKLDVADLIIVACAAVIQIDSHLRGIDAEIKLLSQSAALESDILDIKRPSEEEPPPAEERPYLREPVGSQSDTLAIAAQHEVLECARGLHHHRKLVVLWLDIIVLRAVEASNRLADPAQFLAFE